MAYPHMRILYPAIMRIVYDDSQIRHRGKLSLRGPDECNHPDPFFLRPRNRLHKIG